MQQTLGSGMRIKWGWKYKGKLKLRLRCKKGIRIYWEWKDWGKLRCKKGMRIKWGWKDKGKQGMRIKWGWKHRGKLRCKKSEDPEWGLNEDKMRIPNIVATPVCRSQNLIKLVDAAREQLDSSWMHLGRCQVVGDTPSHHWPSHSNDVFCGS